MDKLSIACLEHALKKMKVMPPVGYQFKEIPPTAEYLLVGVTERQVPRCIDSENQQEDYSGKKKLHTMKNLVIRDERGYLVFVSDTYQGSTHDKSIWDQMQFDFGALNVLADLGFQGAAKDHPNVILPYKKSKNKPLTPLQKDINKAVGSE